LGPQVGDSDGQQGESYSCRSYRFGTFAVGPSSSSQSHKLKPGQRLITWLVFDLPRGRPADPAATASRCVSRLGQGIATINLRRH
jgi:hypothetical protein